MDHVYLLIWTPTRRDYGHVSKGPNQMHNDDGNNCPDQRNLMVSLDKIITGGIHAYLICGQSSHETASDCHHPWSREKGRMNTHVKRPQHWNCHPLYLKVYRSNFSHIEVEKIGLNHLGITKTNQVHGLETFRVTGNSPHQTPAEAPAFLGGFLAPRAMIAMPCPAPLENEDGSWHQRTTKHKYWDLIGGPSLNRIYFKMKWTGTVGTQK